MTEIREICVFPHQGIQKGSHAHSSPELWPCPGSPIFLILSLFQALLSPTWFHVSHALYAGDSQGRNFQSPVGSSPPLDFRRQWSAGILHSSVSLLLSASQAYLGPEAQWEELSHGHVLLSKPGTLKACFLPLWGEVWLYWLPQVLTRKVRLPG